MNHQKTQDVDHVAVREILDGAAEISGDDRRQFLDEQCADNAALRAEVESLLAALHSAHGLLDDPTGCAGALAAREDFNSGVGRLEDAAGARIGRYRLLQQIGEGGFGVVFMAEQEHPVRRTVALKIIKLGMDTRQVVARFEAERQALAMMDHPSIAKVLDAGTTETGRPYFVMELVRGSPITQYCDKHRLSPRHRLELFVQVCQAVQHAHSKGIIHRDIKPTNVLVTVTEEGRPVPKIIDFGIAKATAGGRLTDRTLFTEFRQLIGTPLYMSPEQAESDGMADVDTRSDIYSLGVLLYELLTGATPFSKDLLGSAAYDEVRRIIREEEPARPSTRFSTLAGEALTAIAASRQTDPKRLEQVVRGELDWIVMRALEKDRSRRYETASALARDVERYLSDEPVEACPPSRACRLRKFVRRNKGPVTAGAAILSVLVAGLALATAFYIRAERQRREAQTQATIAEAVTQFLSDMLGSADPRKSLGDKLTVLQATEAAVKELDAGELRDQPLVEAAVRETIGNSLIALGRFDTAEPNLQRSLELSRRLGNAGDLRVAASLYGLASVFQERGQTAKAEPLAREALEIRRQKLGDVHPRTAESVILLAVVLQAQGKSAEAEPLLRVAVRLQRSALPPGHPDLNETLATLAGLLHVQGKLNEAEPLYREVMEVRRVTLPAAHPDLAQSLHNMAGLLVAQGKLADADPLCREALNIYRTALPDSHPKTAQCAKSLGEVLRDQGRLSAAEPLLREALEIYRKALPAEHPEIATSLSSLASVLAWQGKLAEAEPLAREAVAINRKSQPPGHWATAHALNNLATLLLSRRKPAEAETLAREALEINQRAHPAKDLNDAWSLNNLAEALKAQNKLDEAEPLHREALEISRRVLPPANPKLVDPLIYLAGVLSEQGKPAEAEPLYREALEIETKTHGPKGGRTSWLASRLATVRDELNRHGDADAIRRQNRTDHPARRSASRDG